jgi:gamma-glutamyl:cysteine ligase YbdK (ATP-grasp superfamily)
MEVIMVFKKQVLDVVQGENAKAMVKILQDENKRICEELKDMKEQRDNALKIAENAILELRGRG